MPVVVVLDRSYNEDVLKDNTFTLGKETDRLNRQTERGVERQTERKSE